ncbi:UTP--glucose-1-phosphate uridylyltransferase [Sediminicola sp. YIK13]|uniref:nucleotidyltransferase family protein n=1 Tax=Sediminicola sp. YIK13 TaxID=1453352 RepID=UPI000722FF88|nr:sugar phosphate nucleotidyltransferase [Sediminicola sp. YIK13]ALM09257.1 UTP--glucose-1-phosphate uridylyltransferase [Sediminicola sp. YIK13]
MTLLLMAAGKGSRYGKLKQFDGLGPKEEFLMEFSIYDAIDAGFDHVVIITQRDHVAFLKDHLMARIPKNIKLDVLSQELEELPPGTEILVERNKPWGTAHAVWTARNQINSPFVVLNADDYYGRAAFGEAASFIKNPVTTSPFAMVGYTLKETLSPNGSVSRGICSIKNGNLLSVEERLKIISENGEIVDLDSGKHFSGEEMVSMNFWVCHPSLFSEIETYFSQFLQDKELIKNSEVYLPFVIQYLIAKQKTTVAVLPANGKWFGVTYANDRELAVMELAEMTHEQIYPSPLWGKTN